MTPATSLADVATAARANGVSVRGRLPRARSLSVDLPNADEARLADVLRSIPGVSRVAKATKYAFTSTPGDPAYADQAAYFGALGAETAWDTATGSGAVIAVIDAGVDDTHPDLAGQVVGRYNAVDGSEDVTDYDGHGTAVASVAAGASNSNGIVGGAFDSKILAVKVVDEWGDVYSDAAAEGIRWAAEHGADVINLSFGSAEPDPLLTSAVAAARSAGAVVVAAAGNGDPASGAGDTVKNYPAADSGVISVGATSTSGAARAAFSTYGSWVKIAAPGEGIMAALPVASDVGDDAQDGYAVVEGTSFSAPLVASAVALVRSRNAHLSGAQAESLVLGAHDGKTLGFARGNVQYAAAVAGAPNPAPPAIESPANGAVVSGDVNVVAASSASAVQFSFAGTDIAVIAPVVDGRASASLPSWGLADNHSIRAVSCAAGLCAGESANAVVLVDNPAPTISSPASGSSVGTSFVASATAGGGAVAFMVDGARKALDATAPHSSTISTTGLAEGTHTLVALQCNRTGTRCDTTSPSASRSFTVRRLHPTLSVAPTVFSPNGDGRRDALVLTYGLERTQSVDLTITSPSGATVRSGRIATSRAKGTYTWSWNGRNNAGALVGNATYKVQIDTFAVVAGSTVRGTVSRTARVDRTKAALSSLAVAPTTVYPAADGYLDTARMAVTTNEPLVAFKAEIFNSAGTRVRTVDAGPQAAGRRAVIWNGRTTSGAVAPAGSYTYRIVATDQGFNVTTTGKAAIAVSAKRLAARTGTKTVSPHGSRTGLSIAYCSDIFLPARSAWTNSYGYYSNYHCLGESTIAAATHSLALPAAVKYGNVKIAAYGGSATYYPDGAAIIYIDRNGALAQGFDLGPADGTRTGPTVSAASLLSGRTVSWLAGTVDGNWYDIKSFTVTWTYYVLV